MRKLLLLPALVFGLSVSPNAQNWSSCIDWDYTIYGNYIVRNNTWGSYQPGYVSPQCMTATSQHVWTVSANHQNGTGQVKSYPQCWTGWQKGNGWIVPPSILPALASPNSSTDNVLIDWSFTGPSTGRYLTALDCYTHSFPNPGNGGNGGSDDAEWNILIFPQYQDNTGYFQGDTLPPNWQPGRYFIDGKWWYVQVNFNSGFGWCKRHMVFKAVQQSNSLNSLNLNQFIQFGRNQGWVNGTQYITSVQAGWELIDGGSGFASSIFNVQKTTVLGVETSDFNANPVQEMVHLDWTVTAEKNNDYFQVERSADGLSFDPLGTVPGRGNANTAFTYHFTDRAPLPYAYYRIQQRDFDGTATYSKVLAVKSRLRTLKLSPNPASEHLQIQMTGVGEQELYRITDLTGNTVQSGELSENTTVDISTLSPGVYLFSAGGQKTIFVRQ